MKNLNRREFIKTSAAGLAVAAIPEISTAIAAPVSASRPALPLWRGFNLLNFFQAWSKGETCDCTLSPDDLKWIRDWGFNFVRLPMDYWLWIDSDCVTARKLDPADACKIKESTLEKIDKAVEACQSHQLHLSLNFHRAPGYCINNPTREPFVLWSDKAAEDAFVYHWEMFAKRYKGVSESALSFNLLNEAPGVKENYMSAEDYRRVMARATEAIRKHSPKRTVIIDGFSTGSKVVTEMISTGVAQSVHAYTPGQLTHYRASWVDKKLDFPMPTWPMLDKNGKDRKDRAFLEKLFEPWGELSRKGIGVHCGECGCYNKTPAPVFLAWFTDVMDILKGHNIGWALWNFRGTFGILDSGRSDVKYEDWQGHKLDRNLLAMLQKY